MWPKWATSGLELRCDDRKLECAFVVLFPKIANFLPNGMRLAEEEGGGGNCCNCGNCGWPGLFWWLDNNFCCCSFITKEFSSLSRRASLCCCCSNCRLDTCSAADTLPTITNNWLKLNNRLARKTNWQAIATLGHTQAPALKLTLVLDLWSLSLARRPLRLIGAPNTCWAAIALQSTLATRCCSGRAAQHSARSLPAAFGRSYCCCCCCCSSLASGLFQGARTALSLAATCEPQSLALLPPHMPTGLRPARVSQCDSGGHERFSRRAPARPPPPPLNGRGRSSGNCCGPLVAGRPPSWLLNAGRREKGRWAPQEKAARLRRGICVSFFEIF